MLAYFRRCAGLYPPNLVGSERHRHARHLAPRLGVEMEQQPAVIDLRVFGHFRERVHLAAGNIFAEQRPHHLGRVTASHPLGDATVDLIVVLVAVRPSLITITVYQILPAKDSTETRPLSVPAG